MRTIAEVVEDIKNGTWGSDIEYQSECEKLHKLCDEILEIEKAKAKRIVAELEEERISAENEMHRLRDGEYALPCQFDRTDIEECIMETMSKAIDIVRKGGVE